jgi:hypothetical protein
VRWRIASLLFFVDLRRSTSWKLSAEAQSYFVSRCAMCLRQKRQYLLSSSRSLVFFLFLVVL